MPGATLRALGLPFKGYKNGVRALELRRRILAELSWRSGLPMPNLDDFEEQCLFSHDCLDAVVATVTAALWVRQPDLFWRPQDPGSSPSGSTPPESIPKKGESDLDLAVQEGWLYAPVFIPPGPEAESQP